MFRRVFRHVLRRAIIFKFFLFVCLFVMVNATVRSHAIEVDRTDFESAFFYPALGYVNPEKIVLVGKRYIAFGNENGFVVLKAGIDSRIRVPTESSSHSTIATEQIRYVVIEYGANGDSIGSSDAERSIGYLRFDRDPELSSRIILAELPPRKSPLTYGSNQLKRIEPGRENEILKRVSGGQIPIERYDLKFEAKAREYTHMIESGEKSASTSVGSENTDRFRDLFRYAGALAGIQKSSPGASKSCLSRWPNSHSAEVYLPDQFIFDVIDE